MNDRQELFVSEYLIDRNATQAAIRAGYSSKTAYSQGQRLLKNTEVLVALETAKQEIKERNHVTVDDVVGELKVIAFAPASDGKGYATKLKALELLGKYLGMFEKQEDKGKEKTAEPPPLSLEEKLNILRQAAEDAQKGLGEAY